MAKMSFKNYKSAEVVKVPESQVDVLPVGQTEVLPSSVNSEPRRPSSAGEFGQSIANAASPVAAICDCVKAGLGTIEVISKCIAAVSIAKEKTAQDKAKYQAQIVESKEQTSRIKIQEKEETKRLKITCENNLKLQKVELEKLYAELSFKEKSALLSHKENMAYIETTQKIIESIDKSKMEAYRILQDDCLDKDLVEKQLHLLHSADDRLTSIALALLNVKSTVNSAVQSN